MSLQQKIDTISTLAKGSKLQRLFHTPIKYIYGQLFSKVLYPQQRKGKLLSTITFFGTEMQVVLPAGMDIYLLGAKTHDSEIRLTKFLLKRLQKGDHFIDIGAHFGFYSLLGQHLVGKEGKVLSVEAASKIYEVLQENTKEQTNLETVHFALTNEETIVDFYEFPILYSEYNTLEPAQYQDAKWFKNIQPEKISVTGKRLDDLVKERQFKPKVIKMDVEGAELQVMEGMQQILQTQSPMIAMEYLTTDRHNASHQAALKLARSYGYQSFLIDNKGDLVKTEDITTGILAQGLDSDNVVLWNMI